MTRQQRKERGNEDDDVPMRHCCVAYSWYGIFFFIINVALTVILVFLILVTIHRIRHVVTRSMLKLHSIRYRPCQLILLYLTISLPRDRHRSHGHHSRTRHQLLWPWRKMSWASSRGGEH